MDKRAVIDGDILLFQAGFAAEKAHYLLRWESEEQEFPSKKEVLVFLDENKIKDYELVRWREVEPLSHAIQNIETLIASIADTTKVTKVEIYLTGRDNFRLKLAPWYKATRNKSYRPVHEKALKDFLVSSHYRAEIVNGQEADDALGIQVCSFPQSTILCSVDKDLLMIPGWHYNWSKGTVFYQEPDSALECFYKQLLMGDRIDNIPGVPGLGEVRATALLKEKGVSFKTCREAYQKAGLSEEQLLLNGKLLWIRRKPDEIWNPPDEI